MRGRGRGRGRGVPAPRQEFSPPRFVQDTGTGAVVRCPLEDSDSETPPVELTAPPQGSRPPVAVPFKGGESQGDRRKRQRLENQDKLLVIAQKSLRPPMRTQYQQGEPWVVTRLDPDMYDLDKLTDQEIADLDFNIATLAGRVKAERRKRAAEA
eukprot:TRINITY_DN50222_c0_g1_i1.p2 TRINITY_DN50222_c0_g1~~TRINITY_DN50222_c0_g1_i1.p2  ORF type:complete len:177 (+),score=59.86 TRINITY_DN50222_c0_g1_i1:70-531(+)